MVQGRTAYIEACGPRTKGAKPGNELVLGKSATSAAVYKGFTAIPSGVCHVNAFKSPLGADLAAALAHCSSCSVVLALLFWLISAHFCEKNQEIQVVTSFKLHT